MSLISFRKMNDAFNTIFEKYVDTLDDWQREVDDIRKMHHEIWTESRIIPIIRQHRAGSRVEKQCRILPRGKQTDVDYKFEVTGIIVDMENKNGFYWKFSDSTGAHGKIFVSNSTKSDLMRKVHYCEIFTENVFEWTPNEDAYLLLPEQFKNSVVKFSQFEYRRDATPPPNSPSVPGQGAVNEYDIVPCLRISKWPQRVHKLAFNVSDLTRQVPSKMVDAEPLFVVPAGDPCSSEKEQQFRLSFSLLEVKYFEELSPYFRKLYGLIKYVFKTKVEHLKLLDSYHIKSLFFSWVDNNFNQSCHGLTVDLIHFYKIVYKACKEQKIEHIFIKRCNIFPHHHIDRATDNDKGTLLVLQKLTISSISPELCILLRQDLRFSGEVDKNWLSQAEIIVDRLHEGLGRAAYINGYLTRLLSLVTNSLNENMQRKETLAYTISKIQEVFREFSRNGNIVRLIPMVNGTLEHLDATSRIDNHPIACSREDNVSISVHVAFQHYLIKNFDNVMRILNEIPTNTTEASPNYIGVSITNHHKKCKFDKPLCYVISALERGHAQENCPRFYMDPVLLAHHLKIQARLNTTGKGPDQTDLDTLEALSVCLSDRAPYLGRLSYKSSAFLLLQGYRETNQSSDATNFDLR